MVLISTVAGLLSAHEYRDVDDIDECVYTACAGEEWLDSSIWVAVRTLHLEFPVVPVRGPVYAATVLVNAYDSGLVEWSCEPPLDRAIGARYSSVCSSFP
jgi:hypothetical protein